MMGRCLFICNFHKNRKIAQPGTVGMQWRSGNLPYRKNME